MSECERLNIGWLAWSWGPGNFDSPEMDMTVHGSYNTLIGWGKEVAVDSPLGIQNTSVIPNFIQNKDFTTGSQGTGANIIENGEFNITFTPEEIKPVKEYLSVQKRFRHLPEEQIEKIQKYVDAQCSELGL